MKAVPLFIFAALAAASLCCCNSKPAESNEAVYNTLTVAKTDVTLLSEYSAKLSGQQVVEVRPQVSGYITKILIGEGDKVRQGQTLFIIDQTEYTAALKEATANVRSAEAALETAKINLESTQMLHQSGVVQDYDLSVAQNNKAAAEATLLQAQAQEEIARHDLYHTEVRSPVDGVAGMISYRVGALVSSSIDTPLVTVADDSTIQAYFSLTEAQVIDLIEQFGSLDKFLELAPDVSLRMSNGKIYPLAGRISAVSGIVTSGTNAVTLRADFTNQGNLLRDGGSGSVILSTEKKQCIVIPQTATYDLQGRFFVYKVIDGKASSSPVEVFRLNNGTEFIVEDGLTEGDVIIAHGAGLVREGTVINNYEEVSTDSIN